MGDISELRTIVTVGTFLSVLVLLIGWVPAAFYVPEYEGQITTPPEYFEAIELEKYATTRDYTLNTTDASLYYGAYYMGYWIHKETGIGGHDFYIEYAQANETVTTWTHDDGIIRIRHITYWVLWEWGTHTMEIAKEGISKGKALDRTELDSDYNRTRDLSYTFECDHLSMDIFFGFNETLYDSPSEAFDHYDLTLMVGLEWDQVTTSMSAWAIIAMIMWFQLPNIHWIINAIIAIPIWLGIAYVSYILILRAVGAIFGGGA